MAAGIQIGSTFAGYSIEGVLGRGGMGVVYLASQPELGRKVAIKVIAPALASDPDYLERFKRESRLAAAIEHPNAIPIYEAGVADEEIPYLVMRYVDGVDLASLIRRRGDAGRRSRRPDRRPGVRAPSTRPTPRGLVHRDVKPGNVIVERATGHRARLPDRLRPHQADGCHERDDGNGTLGGDDRLRVARADQGQAAWMPRSDVYSLGCVLFVALTGRLPFEREADVAKLYAHINDPAPAPSSVAEGVSPELDAVVARALAKDPGERFPSAGDLGRAALAASTGSAIGEPERTVATGEAAPVPTGPADASTVPSEGLAADRSRHDARHGADRGDDRGRSPDRSPRRLSVSGQTGRGRWVAAVAGIAVLGLAVLGFSILGGGDSSDGDGGGGTNTGGIRFEPFTKSSEFTVDVPAGWDNTYTDRDLPGQGRDQVRTQLTSPTGS